MNHWSSATEGEAAGSRTAHLLGEGSPWGGPLSGSLGNYDKKTMARLSLRHEVKSSKIYLQIYPKTFQTAPIQGFHYSGIWTSKRLETMKCH